MLACSHPRREWQRGLLKAIRLRIPRPATSSAILPVLLEVGGLLTPDWEDELASPAAHSAAGPDTSRAHADGVSDTGSSTGGSQWDPNGDENGVASGNGAGTAAGAPAAGRRAAQALSAVLPPNARRSAWLAAFLAELSAAWGFPRAAATPRRWLQRLGGGAL